jgi:hypothetical protein
MVQIVAIVVLAAAMTDGGCRDDVQKFWDVGEAKRAVVACLQQHMAELSDECKTKLSQQPS